MTAADFSFETTFVAAKNSRGRLYSTTVRGPHGEASATGDTAMAAATKAAAVYGQEHLGMVAAAE